MAGTRTTQSTNNGMAIASLVLGIIGLFVFPIVLGPIALILGFLAHRSSPSGLAKAGIVLGAIDTILGIIFIATGGFGLIG
ncbi:DUF4190 domain-containing protein [Streptomyces sp. TRM 70351]|uniref:DUF4190 domain-containing protein n=1 Tax=Streptomyces sp. TRM 70351 TaxID=3116552 RepID=UPI002E7C158B|nr:DUF4190 domain-containing protein [Streptomyces sp. TRM 70351]MEE1927935.1 DUF4190 domain-containing protein [Streptomyces sp. TRM 70351]